LVLAMGALGLPGLGNFLAEFLVLAGTFQEHEVFAIVASLGLILSTVYSLWLVQIPFHGENLARWRLPDLARREGIVMAAMIAGLVWLGFYPRPVLDVTDQALPGIQRLSEDVPGSQEAIAVPDANEPAQEQGP